MTTTTHNPHTVFGLDQRVTLSNVDATGSVVDQNVYTRSQHECVQEDRLCRSRPRGWIQAHQGRGTGYSLLDAEGFKKLLDGGPAALS